MEIVDTEKLKTAIVYLQRITEGHNPVNNMPADDDSVINNPNVVRCMMFIKEILEEINLNGGYIGSRVYDDRDKGKLAYPLEVLGSFQYTGDKPVTKFVEQINSLADLTVYRRITYKPITAWLKREGYLAEEQGADEHKHRTVVTDKGNEIGIKSELRKNSKGMEYNYITYSQAAQEFIVANMSKILCG